MNFIVNDKLEVTVMEAIMKACMKKGEEENEVFVEALKLSHD